jgi:magnesium transporter
MSRLIKHSIKKAGISPGSPVFVGRQKADTVRISAFTYDAGHCEERQFDAVEDCFTLKDLPAISWINIDGLHDAGLIDRLAGAYGLHPLVTEDILNTQQRPKLEVFDEYIYVSIKMLAFVEATGTVAVEQVSMVMGSNFVLSFQEKQGDVFDALRKRIREGKGRIRKMGADYLLYALLDIMVDQYFIILEKISDEVEMLEEQLMKEPGLDTLRKVYRLKREILFLRKAVWPLREALSRLEHAESSLLDTRTSPFLRNLYDHVIQVIDAVETTRDLLTGMLDLYLSSVGNRTNEVMKVLTIIATIFIPLTFIAGIYGMNFEFMPELTWRFGYYAVWSIMLVIGVGLVIWFKHKKWL